MVLLIVLNWNAFLKIYMASCAEYLCQILFGIADLSKFVKVQSIKLDDQLHLMTNSCTRI